MPQSPQRERRGSPGAEPLLQVRDLRVEYPGDDGPVRVVDGVSFQVSPGETYAVVGESGCGKTATALSILRLVEPGRVAGGSIFFEGRDLLRLSEREMRRIRGARIGMVFQEAGAALNPVIRVGWQVAEAPRIHGRLGRREAWKEAVRLLREVRLPDPQRQARAYPHELSGGMQQRVMLAIALSCSPALLIADEPTSALDVTIQAQILALLRQLRERYRLTVLLISHDLGVVAGHADRVGVMYAGRMVEEAPVEDLFREPLHPYTRGLLRSAPGAAEGRRKLEALPGTVPDPSHPVPGCRFHPRCPEAIGRCAREDPMMVAAGARRRVACLLHPGESAAAGFPAGEAEE